MGKATIEFLKTHDCPNCLYRAKCLEVFEDSYRLACRIPEFRELDKIMGVLRFDSFMSRSLGDEPLKDRARYSLEVAGSWAISGTRNMLSWFHKHLLLLGAMFRRIGDSHIIRGMTYMVEAIHYKKRGYQFDLMVLTSILVLAFIFGLLFGILTAPHAGWVCP